MSDGRSRLAHLLVQFIEKFEARIIPGFGEIRKALRFATGRGLDVP
jgi:hypothetical protein